MIYWKKIQFFLCQMWWYPKFLGRSLYSCPKCYHFNKILYLKSIYTIFLRSTKGTGHIWKNMVWYYFLYFISLFWWFNDCFVFQVVFTALEISEQHLTEIENVKTYKGRIENENRIGNSTISYTRPYDYLKASERSLIYESLLRFACYQKGLTWQMS